MFQEGPHLQDTARAETSGDKRWAEGGQEGHGETPEDKDGKEQ